MNKKAFNELKIYMSGHHSATDKNPIWLCLFSYLTIRIILHCHVCPRAENTKQIKKINPGRISSHTWTAYMRGSSPPQQVALKFHPVSHVARIQRERRMRRPLLFVLLLTYPTPPASQVPVGKPLSLKSQVTTILA